MPRAARCLSLIFLAAYCLAGSSRATAEEPGHVTLRFEGNSAYSQDELAKLIPVEEGLVPDADWVQAVQRTIVGHYETYGYLTAMVSVRLEPTPEGTDAIISVMEGPRFKFGPTRVEGVKVPTRVVLRELTYKVGDPFNRRELFRTQGRLHRLGIFKDVRVQTSTAPAETVIVHILATPATTQKVWGGVGWGSEEKQRVSFGYSNSNFLRRAYRMELSALYSEMWTELKGELIDRYLFGTKTEARGETRWRRERRDGYKLEQTGGRVRLGRDLWWGVTGTLGYRSERTVTFDVSPGISDLDIAPNARTHALQTGLSLDTTRDPFFPTQGHRTNLSYERAGGILGGDVHYDKLFARTARYWAPWKPPVVFAFQVQAGAMWPFNPSEEVPIYERFFTGGANSVRGYRERGVGPQVDGDPVGGRKEFGASLETRFPIIAKLNGAVFLDGGQVGNAYAGVKPSEWKYGVGTGLRYVTLIGPLRLDFGYKLNRDVGDEDLWRLHFSLGEAF